MDSDEYMDMADDVSDESPQEKFKDILKEGVDACKGAKVYWDELTEQRRGTYTSSLFNSLSTSLTAFENKLKNLFNVDTTLEGQTVLDDMRDNILLSCREAGLVASSSLDDGRSTTILHGLDQEYLGTFDLNQFEIRISETFKWYNGGHKDFISPSFALVQSSGMGKTKLMKEYKQRTSGSTDIAVIFLLCVHGDKAPPKDFDKHFDDSISVPNLPINSSQTEKEEGRKKFLENMNDVFSRHLGSKKKAVLLLDESQSLAAEQGGGMYVCLRWWLRQTRNVEIVAVFAGTLLSLATYQRVKPSLGWTRDPSVQYLNYNHNDDDKVEGKRSLYDPFYIFTTMAMEHSRVKKGKRDNFKDELHDIRRCGYFGRPLFASMLKEFEGRRQLALTDHDIVSIKECHVIANERLYNILKRVLLSNIPGWSENVDSLASVLGTRVQMGISSYDFAAAATSKGYANLVQFRGDCHFPRDQFGVANIVFPPDPICAALAMGLMQSSWSLCKSRNEAQTQIRGEEPSFWVRQANVVFEQSLFLPTRGDAGEVLAALYMLLCGDELRRKQDGYMRRFEINLLEWFELLKSEEESSGTKRKHSSGPKDNTRRSPRLSREPADATFNTPKGRKAGIHQQARDRLKINFIQVVRNYFRTHAWFSKKYLEFMYKTATGCYVFGNCPAIDLVFPISYDDTYHAALVSVKCWDYIGHADMKKALADMKTYLEGYRKDEESDTKALCILIVIGSQKVGSMPAVEGQFPEEDAFVTVVVPPKDRFGVSNIITQRATTSVRAEILASHPFAHVEVKEYNALRTSTLEVDAQFGDMLLEDQQSADDGDDDERKS